MGVGCRFISRINSIFQNEGWVQQDVWLQLHTVVRMCFCVSMSVQAYSTVSAGSTCVFMKLFRKRAHSITLHTCLLTSHRKVGRTYASMGFPNGDPLFHPLQKIHDPLSFGGSKEGQAFPKHNWGRN